MYRIGIDVDDVLNDSLERCLEILNSRFDTSYTEESFDVWDIYDTLPKEHADELAAIFNSEVIWHSMLPPSDAQSAVSKLVKDGHKVYFLSACDAKTHGWKSKWLQKIYPYIPKENHIYTYHKELVSLDFLVDDNPDNLKLSMAYRVLMTKPWNLNAHEYQFDERVGTMSDVKDLIEGMWAEYDR